tara:strand:- start:397 stop:501 length:105 start_codon:yes stop_codon:yes gene_type:complete
MVNVACDDASGKSSGTRALFNTKVTNLEDKKALE